MRQIDRAHRVHECITEAYWVVRHMPQVHRRLIEADLHIHEIIRDYERRGMQHADATASEPESAGSAETPDGVDSDTERLRGSGYLW